MHAVAFICSLRGVHMEDYVHKYYSLARFRIAYARKIPALNDKSKWEKADLAFKVFPSVIKRPPGRPRKERIPGCLEANKKRQRCKRSRKLGHQQRTCKEDDLEAAASKRYYCCCFVILLSVHLLIFILIVVVCCFNYRRCKGA
jgi:hypothetical protein